MNALTVHPDGRFLCENIAEPAIVNDDDVLIRVRACGVCGSDKNWILGRKHGDKPLVRGHEFAGEIVDTGAAVTSFGIGDRVVGIPILPCHNCDECRQGLFAQCADMVFTGQPVQGAFAEYIVLPQRNVLRIADSLSYEHAALIEPSTVAVHALKLSAFEGFQDVAILGFGTIGYFLYQWARYLGARRIAVFDSNQYRLKLASALGVDLALNTADTEFVECARQLTDGKGFGYIFEAAGENQTFRAALELTKPKAKICYIGIPTTDLTFSPGLFWKLYANEVILVGELMSFSAPFPGDEWFSTIEAFGAGKIELNKGPIAHRFGLSEIDAVRRLLDSPERVKGKIMFLND